MIGRRLSRLDKGCNRILGIAAVVGRDFTFEEVGRACDRTPDEIRSALDEAVQARLIEDGVCDRAHLDRVTETCQKLLIDTVDRAQGSADADPELERPVYAR